MYTDKRLCITQNWSHDRHVLARTRRCTWGCEPADRKTRRYRDRHRSWATARRSYVPSTGSACRATGKPSLIVYAIHSSHRWSVQSCVCVIALRIFLLRSGGNYLREKFSLARSSFSFLLSPPLRNWRIFRSVTICVLCDQKKIVAGKKWRVSRRPR